MKMPRICHLEVIGLFQELNAICHFSDPGIVTISPASLNTFWGLELTYLCPLHHPSRAEHLIFQVLWTWILLWNLMESWMVLLSREINQWFDRFGMVFSPL